MAISKNGFVKQGESGFWRSGEPHCAESLSRSFRGTRNPLRTLLSHLGCRAGRKKRGKFSILWIIIVTLLVLMHWKNPTWEPMSSPPVPEPAEQTTSGTLHGIACDVRDGDTFYIQDSSGKKTKIRFQAIDAPERNQPGGLAAQRLLEQLVSGKEVRAEIDKIDAYGRTVCHVFVENMDVEERMLHEGLAWHYKKYNTDPRLSAAEASARAGRRGIWQEEHPVPPWQWRRR
ncbi:MAG: thermonuclease family protein [Planctomycetia bacterium]|nr:thermonuclease family protein [Planctomycetia bacterium]